VSECKHEWWRAHFDRETWHPSRVECWHCGAPINFVSGSGNLLTQPEPIGVGNLWQPSVTPDAALRARYASAVRTLQKMADHGGTRYGGDHMEEMAKETLIQLGEPIEPEGM
jgi:hypothetical protein